ncbi:hypothetical protein ABWW58_02870 [Sporolactobacillus sp. STCC-11]|uniref:hypothetical protein n=1 Tax=Sporolactobacillus caesalpiniae TaxID=3230362 RepID=UPI0033941FF4
MKRKKQLAKELAESRNMVKSGSSTDCVLAFERRLELHFSRIGQVLTALVIKTDIPNQRIAAESIFTRISESRVVP